MIRMIAVIAGHTLLTIGLLIATIIVHALTIAKLWEWFATPFGLPVISAAHAVGLGMLVMYLSKDIDISKRQSTNDNHSTWAIYLNWVITVFGRTLLTLLIASVVHSYM